MEMIVTSNQDIIQGIRFAGMGESGEEDLKKMLKNFFSFNADDSEFLQEKLRGELMNKGIEQC